MTTTLIKPGQLNSRQKDAIVHQLAFERPQRAIAKEFNTSQTAISTVKKANEERVATLKQELISDNLEHIQSSIRTDIENNNTIANKYKEEGELTSVDVAYKAATQKNIIKPLMESVGIYPSNTIHYGDTNIQNNVVITPSYQAFLDYQSTQPPVKEADIG
jgi:transcriptional regulator